MRWPVSGSVMPGSSVTGLPMVSQQSGKSLGNRLRPGASSARNDRQTSLGGVGSPVDPKGFGRLLGDSGCCLAGCGHTDTLPGHTESRFGSSISVGRWFGSGIWPVRVGSRREGRDLDPNNRVPSHRERPPGPRTRAHGLKGTPMNTSTREPDRLQRHTHLQPVADWNLKC